MVVNGDHVIGIGRVAHPEQQSEERNRERRGVGRNHQVAPQATQAKIDSTPIFFQGEMA
jgi:hypothetical protein